MSGAQLRALCPGVGWTACARGRVEADVRMRLPYCEHELNVCDDSMGAVWETIADSAWGRQSASRSSLSAANAAERCERCANVPILFAVRLRDTVQHVARCTVAFKRLNWLCSHRTHRAVQRIARQRELDV